jgi:hypothetical protein
MRSLEELLQKKDLPNASELLVQKESQWQLFDRRGNLLEDLHFEKAISCCWTHDGNSLLALTSHDGLVQYGVLRSKPIASSPINKYIISLSSDLTILYIIDDNPILNPDFQTTIAGEGIYDLMQPVRYFSQSGVLLASCLKKGNPSWPTDTGIRSAFVLYDMLKKKSFLELDGTPHSISSDGHHIAYSNPKISFIEISESNNTVENTISIFLPQSYSESDRFYIVPAISNSGSPLYFKINEGNMEG